jgi:hypothetical protein
LASQYPFVKVEENNLTGDNFMSIYFYGCLKK